MDEWQSVLGYCRDKTRVLLAQLIAFVLFPVQLRLRPFDEHLSESTWLLQRRLAVVKLLSSELSNNKQTLISLLDVNLVIFFKIYKRSFFVFFNQVLKA